MYNHKLPNFHMPLENRISRCRAVFSQKLKDEIEKGMYVVYLQPKVELKNGRILGAEALVRRREVNGILTSPMKFVPRLEAEGSVSYIDFYVLGVVCSMLREWKRVGIALPMIAVNFSRVTLMTDHVVDFMLQICEENEIDPCRITIEVTESIGKIDARLLKSLVTRIKEAGFSISLDDFGSQYSNMSLLSSIQFNELKIDKSLIDDIVFNEKSIVIVRHIIEMGQELNGTRSVAEGIETEEQFQLLKDLNCDYGQGFFFSEPVPIPEFQALLEKQM